MKQKLIPPLVFLAAAFLLYWQVGFLQFELRWDATNCFLAWRYNVSEALRSGDLPLWSPYQHLGFPLHADPETGAWYPIVWLLSFIRGYDFYTINFEWCFHVFIAGYGMFRFLKSLNLLPAACWIAGISFMGAGMFVSNAQNFIYLIGIAWFPWVLMYTRLAYKSNAIKPLLYLVLCLFMMCTGSYPGITIIAFYSLLAAAFYFLIKQIFQTKDIRTTFLNWIKVSSMLVLLSLVTCAVWIVSIAEFLPDVSRAGGLTPEKILENPLSLPSFISFITPYAVGTTENTQWGSDFSMLNTYAGILSIFMIVLWIFMKKKQAIEWLTLSCFCLFLMIALGNALPLRMMASHLPGLNLFRHPSIFRFFALFILIVFCAIALTKAHQSENRKSLLLTGIVMILFLALLVISKMGYIQNDLFARFIQELRHPVDHSGILVAERIFIQGIIQLLFVLAFIPILLRKRKTLLIALVSLDIFLATQFNIPATVVYPIRLSQVMPAFKGLPSGDNHYRGSDMLKINSDSCSLHIYGIVCNHHIFLKQPAWDGYNSYILNNYNAWEHSSPYPSNVNHPLVYSLNHAVIEHIELHNNEVNCDVRCDSNSAVILQQNFNHNWHCTLDDREMPIVIVNETMMKIETEGAIEKGKLKFIYHPVKSIIAFWITLFTLISIVLVLIYLEIKGRHFFNKKTQV